MRSRCHRPAIGFVALHSPAAPPTGASVVANSSGGIRAGLSTKASSGQRRRRPSHHAGRGARRIAASSLPVRGTLARALVLGVASPPERAAQLLRSGTEPVGRCQVAEQRELSRRFVPLARVGGWTLAPGAGVVGARASVGVDHADLERRRSARRIPRSPRWTVAQRRTTDGADQARCGQRRDGGTNASPSAYPRAAAGVGASNPCRR